MRPVGLRAEPGVPVLLVLLEVPLVPGDLRVALERQHVGRHAIENFAGCAVVISHDRFFLDRLATHILAFEGDSHVEWFEGDFDSYEEDKKRRLGADSLIPKRIKFQKFGR